MAGSEVGSGEGSEAGSGEGREVAPLYDRDCLVKRRDGKDVWVGEALIEAVIHGRLEELGLRHQSYDEASEVFEDTRLARKELCSLRSASEFEGRGCARRTQQRMQTRERARCHAGRSKTCQHTQPRPRNPRWLAASPHPRPLPKHVRAPPRARDARRPAAARPVHPFSRQRGGAGARKGDGHGDARTRSGGGGAETTPRPLCGSHPRARGSGRTPLPPPATWHLGFRRRALAPRDVEQW